MGITGSLAVAASAASIYSSVKSATRSPSQPVVPVLPPLPDFKADMQAATLASQNAAALQKRKIAGAQGRASTILTGPSGVTAPAVAPRSTLLGL